jgi:transcriptional regulator with XRE-family HTH domain
MKRAPATPFWTFIGTRLRTLREQYGARQDEVATAARQWGLQWTRATVAAIEIGRRQLSVQEFLLLPYVLKESQPITVTAAEHEEFYMELADFFSDDGDGWIELTRETSALPQTLRDILQGHAWDSLFFIDTPRYRQEQAFRAGAMAMAPRWLAEQKAIWEQVWPGARLSISEQNRILIESERDTEQKAAYKLRVPAFAIAVASRKLWGCSLTDERDRCVAEQTTSEATPRTVQAIRGHVTRSLLTEIEPLVAGLKKDTSPAALT